MKKLLLFVSVLTLGLTSCTKDDDTAVVTPDLGGNLAGRWELFQQGQITNGQETLTNYQHIQGCVKDFSDFQASGILKHHVYTSGGTCNESVSTGAWARSGNMVTMTIGGSTQTAEIMMINDSMLKLKYTSTSSSAINIFVYKKKPAEDTVAPAFEGTWEYSKEGILMNGTEVLQDYMHTPGCEKDYAVITTTTVTDHTYYMDNGTCVEDTFSTLYTRAGNTLTITVDGEILTAQIVQLDNETLKITSAETFNGQTVEYITVYTRR